MKTGNINHRGFCGYNFLVRDGVVGRKSFIYQCQFCKGLVNSNVKTGRIDHRSVCNKQFYVKDSEVSKQTRRHAHSCPVCSTVVWSSLSCGRIAVKHDMPSGKPCHNKEWHVPEKNTTKTKKMKAIGLCSTKCMEAACTQTCVAVLQASKRQA